MNISSSNRLVELDVRSAEEFWGSWVDQPVVLVNALQGFWGVGSVSSSWEIPPETQDISKSSEVCYLVSPKLSLI